MIKGLKAAFAAAAMLGGLSACSESGNGTAASAETLAIPFNPPLDRALASRISKSETRPGQPAQPPMSIDFNIRFERAGDGYRMTVTHIVPPALRGAQYASMAALLARPIVMRVDGEGNLVSMENEAAYWASIEQAMAPMLEQGGDPRAAAAARGLLRDMRNMPDEERLAKIGENFVPILGFAGDELARGASRREPRTVQTPLGPLNREVVVTIDKVEDGIAYVTSVVTVPPQQMEQAMRQLLSRLGPDAAQVAGQLRVLSFEQRERGEVSVETGLARRFELQRTMEMEAQGQRGRSTTTQTVELVR
jgi:hypothetical protein